MNGNITRRGAKSWRIKYELPRDSDTGRRRTAYKTIKGTRKDAERELRAILHRMDKGIGIDPSKITVGVTVCFRCCIPDLIFVTRRLRVHLQHLVAVQVLDSSHNHGARCQSDSESHGKAKVLPKPNSAQCF